MLASFDWVVGIDSEEAVERQREVTRLSAERPLVVQTGVLEEETDNWPPPWDARRSGYTRPPCRSPRMVWRPPGWPRLLMASNYSAPAIHPTN